MIAQLIYDLRKRLENNTTVHPEINNGALKMLNDWIETKESEMNVK